MFAVLPFVLLGLQLFISAVFQGTGIPLFAVCFLSALGVFIARFFSYP